MRLVSDYEEWYDKIFNDEGPVFERKAFEVGGKSKRQQLALFDELKIKTPPHGFVHQLYSQFLSIDKFKGVGKREQLLSERIQLVVYIDEFAHCGKGKEKLSLKKAMEHYPDLYASLFVPRVYERAESVRCVGIGRRHFWMHMVAETVSEWRSCPAEIEEFLEEATPQKYKSAFELLTQLRVMWAIDFVVGAEGLWAIDWNTAPLLKGLNNEGVITDYEILQELNWAVEHIPQALTQP